MGHSPAAAFFVMWAVGRAPIGSQRVEVVRSQSRQPPESLAAPPVPESALLASQTRR